MIKNKNLTFFNYLKKGWLRKIIASIFCAIGIFSVIALPIEIYSLNTYNYMSYEFNNPGVIGKTNDLYYNYVIGKYQHDVRGITIQITRGCGSDEMCYITAIYDYLKKNFNYIPVEKYRIYSPVYTIKTRAYDCKNAVVTFCSMMRSVGQDCYWKIEYGKQHIYALSNVKDFGIFKIDLTTSYEEGLGLFENVS